MSQVSPDHLNYFASELIQRYEAIELELLKKLTKRLKTKGTEGINEWYVERLKESRLLDGEFYKKLEETTGVSKELISQAVEETAKQSQIDIDNEIKQAMPVSSQMNDLDKIMQGYQKQVFLNMDNYVNQSLLSTMFGEGPMMKVYENVLNDTMASFGAGNITLQQAIEKSIINWASKGIPSTFVDKGGNTWSLERYVDTVMRSTLNRLYNEVRTSRMDEYGIHTVKMSVLIDAAERCAYCQGKVLDMRPVGQNTSGYPSIYEYGYGLAGGTMGINCRHSIFPFIPGVNIDREPDVSPEEAIEKSKVREKQRELERRIRKTKKNIIISDELGSPSKERYELLLRKQQKDMRELLKDANWLRRNYGREKVITPVDVLMGKGNVAKSEKVKSNVVKSTKSATSDKVVPKTNNKVIKPKIVEQNTQTNSIKSINKPNKIAYNEVKKQPKEKPVNKKSGLKKDVKSNKNYLVGEPNYEKWEKSLSKSEKESINRYTENSNAFNGVLRDRKEFADYTNWPKSDIEMFVDGSKRIAEAITKYEADMDFTVYRRTSLSKSMPEFIKGQNVVVDKGFFSTSFSKEVTNTFAKPMKENIRFEINVKKGSKVGAYVEKFSNFPEEKEFLIKPNAEFKILDIVDDGKEKTVIMEVI